MAWGSAAGAPGRAVRCAGGAARAVAARARRPGGGGAGGGWPAPLAGAAKLWPHDSQNWPSRGAPQRGQDCDHRGGAPMTVPPASVPPAALPPATPLAGRGARVRVQAGSEAGRGADEDPAYVAEVVARRLVTGRAGRHR